MNLLALKAFTDNYIWLVHDGSDALIVDPGCTQPVLDSLSSLGLNLRWIVVTHHHPDHTGGVAELQALTSAHVFAPELPGGLDCPHSLIGQDSIIQALGLAWQVLHLPGHTASHIALYQPEFQADCEHQGILFCGDTLFSAGCGRIFDGTVQQLESSLQQLARLPASTLVCCAHEYTLANLRFAHAVEPDNTAITDYTRLCQALREAGQPTLPSRIGLERSINPFLRTGEPTIVHSLQTRDAAYLAEHGAFAALRHWKNSFQ